MNVLSNILNFKRYTHRPCFYLAIAMGLGIYLGRCGVGTWPMWSIFCGLFIILSLIRHQVSIFFLCLAIFCLGAFYCQSAYLFPSDHIAFLTYQDQKNLRAVEGVIDSDVQMKPTTFGTKKVFELQLSMVNIDGDWKKASGGILVNVFQEMDLSYGDQLQLEGSLYKAFQDSSSKFSYQQYLEDHQLFLNFSVGKTRYIEVLSKERGSWWMALSLRIKHRVKEILAKYLDPQEANMIQAMVLGDRSFLTKDVYAMFSKTGTSHILAISGMNMAIISAILLFVLKLLRFPRVWSLMGTGVFLLAYAVLSGWTASVIRSVLMAIVLLSSFCIEYEADTFNSLGIAALILFLLDPLNLFDIGFQLSFLSVAMIVCLNPLVLPWIERRIKGRILKSLAQAFCISLVAWIGISPVIAYQFEIISPIAIIANIPIVPMADLVIVLSLGLVFFGLVCPPIAIAFAGSLKAVFNFMLILVSWFAQTPDGYCYIHSVTYLHIFIYYFLLTILYLIISFKLKNY
ncbi:MAG: ComEC family competence protein [Candidatus Omnitrophica bacterium]|nr:ComEC family competence protein [Candidatus Omnitrophota bacterium]